MESQIALNEMIRCHVAARPASSPPLLLSSGSSGHGRCSVASQKKDDAAQLVRSRCCFRAQMHDTGAASRVLLDEALGDRGCCSVDQWTLERPPVLTPTSPRRCANRDGWLTENQVAQRFRASSCFTREPTCSHSHPRDSRGEIQALTVPPRTFFSKWLRACQKKDA